MSEVPAPRRVAPFAVAIDGDIPAAKDDGEYQARGKFVLLFDPDGQSAWGGCFRVVVYVEAKLTGEETRDPLLPEIAWAWVREAIDPNGIDLLRGAVSVVATATYGDEDFDNDGGTGELPVLSGKLEIRASWSMDSEDAGRQLSAWASILGSAAGLEPIGAEVSSLSLARRRHSESVAKGKRPWRRRGQATQPKLWNPT